MSRHLPVIRELYSKGRSSGEKREEMKEEEHYSFNLVSDFQDCGSTREGDRNGGREKKKWVAERAILRRFS